MKILLHSDEKRGEKFPKLGLGYLISYVKKYYNDVEFLVSFHKEDLLQKIQDSMPDIVGFTALTSTYSNTLSLAKAAKESFPDIPLLIGGTHISLFPEMLPVYIDVGVLGEGEETFLELVKSFNEKGNIKNMDIKGIVFREGGKVIQTALRQAIEPLDKIPPPHLELLGISPEGPAHLITSRGCPFRCRFCTSKSFFKKPRFHSAEYVVNEIERFTQNFKRRNIVIYDDLFSMDKKRIKDIADSIVERGLGNRLEIDAMCHVRYLDEDILTNFKKMGVKSVSFGIESGSARVLEYLKRGTVTLEEIREVVRLCREYNILPKACFMIGSPYEREEDVQKTIDFIKELKLDQITVNVTTPLPGTDIWEYAKKKGLITQDEWDDKLWGMQSINEENIKDKIILSDMDRDTFFKMYTKLHNLSLSLDRKKEISRWLRQPYNLRLLFIHIKGRIKPYKKRLKRKLKQLFSKNK